MTVLMQREEFEAIAQRAFDSLPPDFTERVENVRIVIEDVPAGDALQHAKGGTLLGLYQGIPLTARTSWYGMSPTVPDTITLYQENIEAACANREEIEHRIVEVLFHELGHYFGMNEKEIRSAMRRYF